MKIELLRHFFLSQIQSFPQLILPRDSLNAGKVVDSLMEVHPNEGVGSNRMISPTQIPISFLRLVNNFEANLLSNFSNNGIVRDLMR